MSVSEPSPPAAGAPPSTTGLAFGLLRERLVFWLLATGCILVGTMIVLELLGGTWSSLPPDTRRWMIATATLCGVGTAVGNKVWTPMLVVAAGCSALNTMFVPVAVMPGPATLMSVFIILTWVALMARPRYATIVGVYAIVAPVVFGADFVRGTLAMTEAGQLTWSLLLTNVAVPLAIGAALFRGMDMVDAAIAARLDGLEHQRRQLTNTLTSRSRELEASREQLMQAQKLKTVGTMASGLAHELNNILTPIRGLAELLAEGISGDHAQRYGQRILDSSISAAQITGALLTYTRQGTFQPVRSNARQLLQGQILPVLSKSLPNGIEMRVDLERNVSIDVDRVLFQQCITNLVFNAVDAMPRGGEIEIRLGTEASTPSEDAAQSKPPRLAPTPRIERADGVAAGTAVIEVRDTGTGIAPEHLHRIFDPFFTTKGVGAGTGLGLAMVQGTVERHGGSVQVRSVPGRGSTFVLRFPLVSSDEASRKWPVLRQDTQGPAVVVVTEDLDALDEYEELLESTECAPICTSDAKAARGLLTDMGDKVDLVVLDLDLHEVDGADMFKRVRELFPELPVITLSEQPMDPGIQRMIGVGPTRSMRKPLDPQLFATLITDLLHPETTYVRDFTPVPLSRSRVGDSGTGWPRGS